MGERRHMSKSLADLGRSMDNLSEETVEKLASRPVKEWQEIEQLIHIVRILKEGLEEISSDDSSEGEVALEILESMDDQCKQSNLASIRDLPELLNKLP